MWIKFLQMCVNPLSTFENIWIPCRFAEMSDKEILEQAMTLNPEARLRIVEGLLKSLDKPDWTIDEIWAEEAEKRLTAFRQGRLKGISMEDVFRD